MEERVAGLLTKQLGFHIHIACKSKEVEILKSGIFLKGHFFDLEPVVFLLCHELVKDQLILKLTSFMLKRNHRIQIIKTNTIASMFGTMSTCAAAINMF